MQNCDFFAQFDNLILKTESDKDHAFNNTKSSDLHASNGKTSNSNENKNFSFPAKLPCLPFYLFI